MAAEAESKCLDVAARWASSKDWDLNNYDFQVSQLQSAPEGHVSVDVFFVADAKGDESPIDDRERLRRSRLLEINVERGEVTDVLASRDMTQLKKQRELERMRSTEENMRNDLSKKQAARAEETMEIESGEVEITEKQIDEWAGTAKTPVQ